MKKLLVILITTMLGATLAVSPAAAADIQNRISDSATA